MIFEISVSRNGENPILVITWEAIGIGLTTIFKRKEQTAIERGTRSLAVAASDLPSRPLDRGIR